ncbi:hypothetical protein [Tahibacter harae]|uniref:Uncharacterized protein n=1 Tax=Tahibacter harae TaxID=2963937 RepID=A0ABT1QWN4_9GAMM|nr:hypothetical protein [Tahibacter harae]MCQ4166699.1 hypothetical protein [Tahibacter harae]
METSIMYLLSFLAAPLLIAAFAVLFVKTHSPWLLAAAILETLSLLFRIALMVHTPLAGMAVFMGAWQLAGLLVTVCVLGFAVTWRPAQ